MNNFNKNMLFAGLTLFRLARTHKRLKKDM